MNNGVKSKALMPFVFGLLMAGQQARARRLGLWEEARPVPPWEWRQMHPISTPAYTEPEGAAVPGPEAK